MLVYVYLYVYLYVYAYVMCMCIYEGQTRPQQLFRWITLSFQMSSFLWFAPSACRLMSPLRPWLVPNPCHWHPNIRWRVQVDQTLVDSHLPSVEGVCTWPKRCICLTLEHGAKESTTSIRRAIHQNECNAATPSNPKYHLTSMKQFPSNKTSRLQSRTMPNHAQPSISTPNRDLLRKETYAPWAAKSWWGGLKEPPIRAGFSSAFFRSSSGKEKSMVKP